MLWKPSLSTLESTVILDYLNWLEASLRKTFDSYSALHQWSVQDLSGFWGSVATYFKVHFHQPPTHILEKVTMPGARWFEGASLNYAERALAGSADEDILTVVSESESVEGFKRGEVCGLVANLAAAMVRHGVKPGDRVAGYLSSGMESVVSFLAAASIGAVWCSCPLEFGVKAVIDRLSQLQPKVLIVADGYIHAGRTYSRLEQSRDIALALAPDWVVHVSRLGDQPLEDSFTLWNDAVSGSSRQSFTPVDFDHPLYVLFSSGTTGLPKAIVHGHGGITLEHLKWHGLQTDVRAGDAFMWPSTTGWMTWNLTVSALLCGARIVMFDGDITFPDLRAHWQKVSQAGVTHLGASAPFLESVRRSNVDPGSVADLSRLRSITAGGAPVSAEVFRWLYQSLPGVRFASASGGTDVCSSFVGMTPLVPVYAGEISCRLLGVAAEAYNERGVAVTDEQGELVITRPMPSMPLGLWSDTDGSRLRKTYFEKYPGVWCHGDWITFTSRGSCVITGRSDATLNRGGVRLGTAEFYDVVEALPFVEESLIVHVPDKVQGVGELLLFVVLVDDGDLSTERREAIRAELRSNLSPRHVPNEIYRVSRIPRNAADKKLEIGVRRLMEAPDEHLAALRQTVVDPSALTAFVRIASARRSSG